MVVFLPLKYINVKTNEVSFFNLLSAIYGDNSQTMGYNFQQVVGPFCFENAIYFWDSYNYEFYKLTILNGKMSLEKLTYKRYDKEFIFKQFEAKIGEKTDLRCELPCLIESGVFGLEEYLKVSI